MDSFDKEDVSQNHNNFYRKKSRKLWKNFFPVINFIVLVIFIIIFDSDLKRIQNEREKFPIDYEIQNLNECYLTVHNFITFNSTAAIHSHENSSDWFQIRNKQSFKTYIYSYTKPFLLELVQNSNDNCLCCQ